MEKELHAGRLPVKCWLRNIEEGAVKQVINLANLPVVFRHVVVLPDCHQGYGMPIGSVLAAKVTRIVLKVVRNKPCYNFNKVVAIILILSHPHT